MKSESIQDQDRELYITGLELKEENLIRIHSRGGLTWQAIESRKVVSAPLGERDIRYSTNTDNLGNVVRVNNILVGPIFDTNGTFRGVVHLVNKRLLNDIDHVDIY